MKTYEHIQVSIENGQADVVLNRPPYNVLNIAMMNEMIDCFNDLAMNSSLRVVLLSAKGKAFSSGVDVGEHTQELVREMIETFSKMFKALWSIPAVTIGAVHGLALGGGCEMALGCDIVLASDKAKLGQPEIGVGVFPPMAVVVFPKLIGRNHTLEWLLSGDVYPAAQAMKIGLINHVFAADTFDEDIREYCRKFTRQSAAVIALTKKAIDHTYDKNALDGMKIADRIYLEELMHHPDATEGLSAFLEKRKPVWDQ
jgi:cyclohexa-1,5-dienecarbonyl-CoA hydratase